METIASNKNPVIKLYRSALKGGENLFAVEGVKLIADALGAGVIPEKAFFTQKAIDKYPVVFEDLNDNSKAMLISEEVAEHIADTKTPQGIFALFEKRTSSEDFTKKNKLLFLDGVQDPRNVGAILRSGEAFGFDGIIAGHNSADPFNRKAARASAGSIFRVKFKKENLTEIIPEYKAANFLIYASALDENATSLRQARRKLLVDENAKIIVVIGSEGNGVSREIIDLCDEKLYVPIQGAESLNASVAAGIICYELGLN